MCISITMQCFATKNYVQIKKKIVFFLDMKLDFNATILKIIIDYNVAPS